MEFDFREAMVGCGSWIRNVKRHTGAFTLHQESVAEHSYYVAMYAWMIARWVESRTDWKIDYQSLLAAVLLHDLEEGYSGDFPYPFKLADKTGAIKQASSEAMKLITKRLCPEDEDDQARLFSIWEGAKQIPALHGQNKHNPYIIELADFMALLSFVWQEVKNGNRSILDHLTGLEVRVQTYRKDARYHAFQPLIVQMKFIVEEIYNGKEKRPEDTTVTV